MLIDGGLAKYGRLVNDYVQRQLGAEPLNYMVTTHYDTDHSGGQIALFLADNLERITQVVATAVGNTMQAEAANGYNQIQIAMSGMAAFIATVGGGYNDGVNDDTFLVGQTVLEVRDAYGANPPANVNDGLELAYTVSIRHVNNAALANENLMRTVRTVATKSFAKATVLAALVPVTAPARITAAANTFFQRAAPPITQGGLVQANTSVKNYNFRTGGKYANTRVYNPGDVGAIGAGIPSKDLRSYFDAAEGKVTMPSYTATAPGLGRNQVVPNRGDELLGIGDPAAPRVYCVAILQRVLRSNVLVSQDNGNGISIGVAIVFNNFVFYTGGDLPADGLNLIPNAVIGNLNIANPALASIPTYKAGHHGSNHSNSAAYLAATTTKSAVISCGYRSFNGVILPSQDTINWFIAAASMDMYYLTNCKVQLIGVPASLGQDQCVPLNKSRVAGDNEFDPGEAIPGDVNGQPKQHRGDIVLTITAAQSTSTNIAPTALLPGQVYRGFNVTYWENDDNPFNMNNPYGTVTVGHTF